MTGHIHWVKLLPAVLTHGISATEQFRSYGGGGSLRCFPSTKPAALWRWPLIFSDKRPLADTDRGHGLSQERIFGRAEGFVVQEHWIEYVAPLLAALDVIAPRHMPRHFPP